jgi:hypothetical protein
MADFDWDGLGVAEGTAVTSNNINTPGNGDSVSIGSSGSPTYIYDRDARGNGVSITGPNPSTARIDTIGSNGAEMCAYQCLYLPSGNPSASDGLIAARTGSSTGTFSSQMLHTAAGTFQFTNTSTTPVTNGTSPAINLNELYQVDHAIIRNTLATPTTSNGRIVGRIKNLSNPTWATSGEFYVDTGYTVNVTVDPQVMARIGKTSNTAAHPQFYLWNLKWKDLNTPFTSTTKSEAIKNFVQPGGPAIDITGTGDWYLIYAIGTANAGGALTYSIVKDSGTELVAPVYLGTGIWRVKRNPASALQYTVTVAEASSGSTSSVFTVPAASTGGGTPGQFRRRLGSQAT